MKLIDSEIKVWRYTSRDQFGGIQRLEKHYKVFGIHIFTKVLDQEDFPSWAHIQLCTIGFTSWKSKFSEYIK